MENYFGPFPGHEPMVRTEGIHEGQAKLCLGTLKQQGACQAALCRDVLLWPWHSHVFIGHIYTPSNTSPFVISTDEGKRYCNLTP